VAEAKPKTVRTIAGNRRARFEYEILEELECGLALQGTEVKSLRGGRGSIQEAYAFFRRGELWLAQAHIPEYAQGNIHNHAPTRERKLLAHRRELLRWEKRVQDRGTTIVPLELYFLGNRIKVRLALVRGKKAHDKREALKEQSARREIDRALSRRR
jgi:SsrA-binding protein